MVTRSGDSERRLGAATRSNDSEGIKRGRIPSVRVMKRLGSVTRISDSERPIRRIGCGGGGGGGGSAPRRSAAPRFRPSEFSEALGCANVLERARIFWNALAGCRTRLAGSDPDCGAAAGIRGESRVLAAWRIECTRMRSNALECSRMFANQHSSIGTSLARADRPPSREHPRARQTRLEHAGNPSNTPASSRTPNAPERIGTRHAYRHDIH